MIEDDADEGDLISTLSVSYPTSGSNWHRTNISNGLEEGGLVEILRYYKKFKNIGLEGFWTDNGIEEEDKRKVGAS